MTQRRIDTGTVSLAIADAGQGGDPLLLVHGFGGAKEDFTGSLGDLASRGWHAVAPDLRGHGSSDWPLGEDSYSLETFARDLESLADALGWGRFALLGHSMGGMVAQVLAASSPDRIEALVLMDTAHGPLEWFDPDLMTLGATVLREQGVEAYVRLAKDLGDADPAHERLCRERPDYEQFCERKALATSPHMGAAMLPVFTSQADRLESLAAFDHPTLVLVGEYDTGFIDHAERLAQTVSGAQLVVVPDAGHAPQFEAPDAWWQALASFLETSRARSAGKEHTTYRRQP